MPNYEDDDAPRENGQMYFLMLQPSNGVMYVMEAVVDSFLVSPLQRCDNSGRRKICNEP